MVEASRDTDPRSVGRKFSIAGTYGFRQVRQGRFAGVLVMSILCAVFQSSSLELSAMRAGLLSFLYATVSSARGIVPNV